MLYVPGPQSCTIICIVDIHRIAVKSLLITLHTIRRGIDKTTDGPFPLILEREAPPVFFTLADSHDNPGFRENDLRLRNMEIPFGKTFDLVFQISHLLIILIPLIC